MSKKLKPEDIYSKFDRAGFRLLDAIPLDCKAKTKLRYVCPEGHVNVTTYDTVRRGRRCPDCRRYNLRKKFSFSIEYVKNKFEEAGLRLLESTYVNSQTNMRYICSCGTEATTTFNKFQRGCRCKRCGIERQCEKQRLSYDYVSGFFTSHGCQLLDCYTSARTKMRYICKCGREATATWDTFRRQHRCIDCGIQAQRLQVAGEKNHRWKPDRENHDVERRFRKSCRRLLEMTFKATNQKKVSRTISLLGYTHAELQRHITSHDNYAQVKDRRWHIDHIFPIKAFLDHGIKDPAVINALDNLQPLEASANLRKRDSYDRVRFLKWLSQWKINEIQDKNTIC